MITCRALSIVAPAGDLIRSGRKRLEIRNWKPEILPLYDLVIVQNGIRLSTSGLKEDPDGKVMALVDVLTIREWLPTEINEACASYWESDWYAWELSNVRRITYPDAVPARLRIYHVTLNTEKISSD